MAEITINITSSLYARGFDANERIHSKAFERVKKLIASQLGKADKFEAFEYLKEGSKADFVRYYNTISVFGDRGVGKTSFLMSLRNDYKNREDGVVLLPLIDPTLFEEKGHLFLLIVSLIDEQINKAASNGLENERKEAFDEYTTIKCQLAQGLPTLDNEGMTYTEPQWHEDEYMMVRGMESVKAAFDLERNFHRFVYQALKVLGAKAFMLMLDDIDVDFKKGWMVLETLRKFLTTPQMIILLSGSMKLYSKNVRKQQWRNFGKELLKNEMESGSTGKVEYVRLVNEIEGQYMQKVLKSEHRVFLYNMKETLLLNDDEFKVQYDKDQPVSLQEAYKNILVRNGVKGAYVTRVFTSFLMATSMRTQIHFLYNMHCGEENDLMSKISAFTSRMYAQNIDVDLMTNIMQYDVVLLHYLINENVVEEAYQLLPNFESTDVNSALTGFSFVFSQLIKREPSLIFDYWNRICLVRNNMHYLSYNEESKNYVGKYCIGAGVFQSRDLKSLVGNSMVFIASIHKDVAKHEGAIPLMGFSEAARGKGRALDRRIDKVLMQANDLQRILGYLPLTTLRYDDKTGRTLHYSVYTLLASIGQILKADGVEEVKLAIKTACMPVNYQVRSYDFLVADEVQNTIPDAEINMGEEGVPAIANAVIAWKEQYMNLSMDYGNYLFGRIATRLYYSFVSIAENNKEEPLGKVFGLFVADIINACLVEESKILENNNLDGININNVSTSSKILADNIGKLNGVVLPFTKWLAACPLLYPYMNLTENQTITNYVRESCDGNILEEELFSVDGSMIAVLDKIACLYQRAKVVFSAGNHAIRKMIQLVNASHLNLEVIMDGDINDAKQELETVFLKVTPRSISTFRNKCQINNGVLELKQQEDE